MGRSSLILASILATVTALAVGSVAHAAEAPIVTTGGPTDVTEQSATLRGTVNPRGQQTTYSFQYGTSTAYGQQTPPQGAGDGNGNRSVSAGIVGLAADTTYHYRLVAANASGTVIGKDRTVKTSRAGNTLTISASPSSVIYGGTTTILGQLKGSGNAARQVALQARPYPYQAGFQQVGNTQLTNATGNYRFAVSPMFFKSQFRVVAATQPTATVSATKAVDVRVSVSMLLSDATPLRGRSVRFRGSVRPPHDGARVSIQKKGASGRYVTVARTRLRRGTATHSSYSRSLRIRTSGRYRVRVSIADGDHSSGISRSRFIRVH